MFKKIHLIILSVVLTGTFACHKTEFNTEDIQTGNISFYNASNKIDSLFTVSKNGIKVIFPLSLQNGQGIPLGGGNQQPFFQGGSTVLNDYPRTNVLNPVPWIVFEDYQTGNYKSDLHFGDITTPVLFSFNLQTMKDKRLTYFLSDSAGKYNTTEVVHQEIAPKGKIRFRFIQLSPDADSANMRINTVLQVGKFQNMPYRKTSGYVIYDMPKDSLLRLRIFNGRDSSNIVGRRDLTVQSGSSYFLIYKGYSKNHDPGKFGTINSILQNAVLDVRKVE